METVSIAFEDIESRAVIPDQNTDQGSIVKALGLPAFKAVLLVFGSASQPEEKNIPVLTLLFNRGIAKTAADCKAIVLDGGTHAGVMKLMGDSIADSAFAVPAIGIAPKALVSYPGNENNSLTPLDPHHSHFVLTPGKQWGAEGKWIFALARELVNNPQEVVVEIKKRKTDVAKPQTKINRLVILVSGGEIAKKEILASVREKLSIIVVSESGGFADELTAAWAKRAEQQPDPILSEIIADGELHFHKLSNDVKGIERLIIRELGVDQVLMLAWEKFADYDFNAQRQQDWFNFFQKTILISGVFTAYLAVATQINSLWHNRFWHMFEVVGHQLLYITPIALTALVAASNKFKQGMKWVFLRAGAEAIKREIFFYRTRSGDYKVNPEQVLAQRVENITRRTMRTEVNLSAIKLYDKDKNGFPPMDSSSRDDGFSWLTPDRYINLRLRNQIDYFRENAIKIDRYLKLANWGVYLVGGLATYLALREFQIWIAVTTCIVATIGTFLGYKQWENTLTKYNQAATDLANVEAWWNALEAGEQAMQENIDSLVLHTEQVIQTEFDGWVQQMQNALEFLRKEQEKSNKGKHPPGDKSKNADS